MPTYEYLCPSCGQTHDIVKLVSEYQKPEHCPDCGVVMNRTFKTPPMGIVDLKGKDAQAIIDGEY